MFFKKIKKKDGRIVDFDADRIKNAFHKALLAVELGDGEKAETLTKEVVKLLEEKFKEQTLTVEDVQDAVVAVLIKNGYGKVAQEYQDYRKKKEELRALREKLFIEPKLTVNALEVLKARYLLRDEKENIIETPPLLFERVSTAIADVDKTYGGNPEKSQKPSTR
jgi:ribonucleoside-diphosphate reductase alpha chain